MGRSVSTHRNAVATVYLHPEIEDDSFGWDDFIEDLQQNVLFPKYPSMYAADRWMDREDHIIAENRYCEVSVSEYCGLVAICLAPHSGAYEDPKAQAWTERISNSFHAHITKMFKSSALSKVGTFSNGESVFEKVTS